ncbi:MULTISPECIES: hydroxymethylglutaryl-CoA lyase [Lysinibacillus]|jgi:hydroxymethylglutaryl-CoA lyase|uniref:Hydroxymethylglutaryl-CoA lyase n=1 Tax=Lysinibacillus fusiformis TaxID=28031 RepID=A0A2I0V691_9BACI|nr:MULTISPECIES: hydroxymethylglutaryl-CoA lyase [Lysinibacillus]KUF35944.1 hydroxymethylglutaryl-CoA lyase [Lysinibacillus sp. F5]PKU53813.1 hydroxymethylglutaryl-CoA lyase [Lysinibacillus fusiformis]SCY51568.1 hydroxymethylglutaryl-CoA lyase [Lysinibacillus sp. SG9]SDB22538.1 hydroxymethylglutaryl-CoA lyase [Lysinibacillus sp. TC-37]SFS72126.1 hydroxymethylglutaryl-CoA lyase [Lysinibacillus sp. SG55]
MQLPKHVMIKEVGPRDGLQNEKTHITTVDKIQLVNLLSQTGLTYIEVTSFVHPKWIPQLADAVEVLQAIKRQKDITYAALVPNMRGLERALQAEVDEVSIFMSASESHNQSNINKTIDDTFPILEEVVIGAKAAKKKVRGYISTVIGCPYEGYIHPDKVLRVTDKLLEMGVAEISLGDTIGVGVPTQVEYLLEALLKRYDAENFAMHFHDTRGTALANIMKSLEMGMTKFDSALGGLGGCPYAKGASGNVATEDLLYLFDEMGIETGIDRQKVLEAALFIEEKLGKAVASKQMAIVRNERSANQR